MIDYEPIHGSIWQIVYYEKIEVEISPSQEQRLLDEYTITAGSTFNPPPGLSPNEYSQMFADHFLKSRKTAREFIEKDSVKLSRVQEPFQVGDQESLNYLSQIENSPLFHSWENPEIVNYFRIASTNYA